MNIDEVIDDLREKTRLRQKLLRDGVKTPRTLESDEALVYERIAAVVATQLERAMQELIEAHANELLVHFGLTKKG